MQLNDAEQLARLERRVDYLIRYLGIDPARITEGVLPPAGLPCGLEVAPQNEAADVALAPVYDALRRRDTLGAIKLYRQLTGASLAEAKSAVASIAGDL